ncbi:formate hydrogenlyase transcriptional activator FlhA, partial [Klebsiella pneumoniae]|nr:formate hydrogenlyase transcriptional activator FlhA [Klebsiella pneumoniae]
GLYHRLNVFPISLPPLRDRGKDVELLGQAFLDELNERHGTKKHFPAAVKEMLMSYPWPGNVRELINCVRRAGVMSEGRFITAGDLGLPETDSGPAVTLAEIRSKAEKDAIEHA